VEWEGLQEAAPLVRGDRVLVADNTRPDTQDGEVESQDGLVLTLSQDVDLSSPAGYFIFLQLPDASVDAIPCVAGPESNQAQLSRPPRIALSLDVMAYARATYQIVRNPVQTDRWPLPVAVGGGMGSVVVQDADAHVYRVTKTGGTSGTDYEEAAHVPVALNDGFEIWLSRVNTNYGYIGVHHTDAALTHLADIDLLVGGVGAGLLYVYNLGASITSHPAFPAVSWLCMRREPGADTVQLYYNEAGPDLNTAHFIETPGVTVAGPVYAKAMLYDSATSMDWIVKNLGGKPTPRAAPFLITDKSSQDGGTYNLQAINYSSMYYGNDTLQLWMTFEEPTGFLDHSAYERDGVGAGGAALVLDSTRGRSYSGASGRSVTLPTFTPPVSYTKAVWCKRADLVGASRLLESDVERFRFIDADLRAGHGGLQLIALWPDASNWHHAAVTWDDVEQTLTIYIDGEPVDSATAPDVASRALHQLTAFQDFNGRASDLRLYSRALSDAEVRELFRATRK
jgi:hypothetical protein